MAIIQVDGKQLVMQVLLDARDDYSVCGYAERMEEAFGLIFLGRDKSDPEYATQSAAAVAAIGAISERAAFDAALAATRPVMQSLAGASTFDIKDVSNKVLAAVCTLWFDLPDGVNVITSGSIAPWAPANCPGHYGPPSGYIFQPDPSLGLPTMAKLVSKVLRSEVGKFVTAQRAAGAPPRGVISSALFAAFPNSPAQDDLLARTLTGVMMGFLPTAQGNLNTVAKAWEDQMFGVLRAAFLSDPEPDLYLRANKVFRDPMIEAMQGDPVPPKIWRTATRDHMLGQTQVRAGDRLFINIDSATHEDIAALNRDPMPIFGGDRSQNPHPTHACPGFKAAMGFLLGLLAGTMETPGGPVISA
jgi:hypothetical protein